MTFYLDSIITFGKYSGKRVSDLPQDYVTWLKENTKHKIRSCNTPPARSPATIRNSLPQVTDVGSFLNTLLFRKFIVIDLTANLC